MAQWRKQPDSGLLLRFYWLPLEVLPAVVATFAAGGDRAVAGRPAAAECDAPVALPDRVRVVVGGPGEALGPVQGEGVLQAVVKALVVGPHAQHMSGSLLPDPAHNRLPAAPPLLRASEQNIT